MSVKGELTELITKQPVDKVALRIFCRNKGKGFNFDSLMRLSLCYNLMKQSFPAVTPLHFPLRNFNSEVVRLLVEEGWDIDLDVEGVGTPLIQSLLSGNVSLASLYIKLGAKPGEFCSSKRTPICYAISEHNKEKCCINSVKLLLNSGVEINHVINEITQERAIHVAVRFCFPSLVRFILQNGGNPNHQDINGFSPIHTAIAKNNVNIVKILLLHGIDLHLNTKNYQTPLCIAVEVNSAEIIQELVKAGLNVNKFPRNCKFPPFHLAVFSKKVEIVKVMVSLGANPNKASSCGTTPLHNLATRGLDKNFREENENSHDLVDMIEYLVANGANLNLLDTNGNSPLQVSIKTHFWGLAKCFVQLGANINTKNLEEDTIFHQVVPLNGDITNLLLEFGGDYNAHNRNGLTPYHIAIMHDVNLKCIKRFLKHGCPYDQDLPIWTKIVKNCKVGKQFFESENTFFKGLKDNNMELINTAISGGALAASCSEDMKYPLHFVALQGYNEVLTFLLKNNVHPNTLDEKGRTALHLAAWSGHYETCQILLRFGACYNYKSKKYEKTPIMIAHELKHSEVVKLFESVSEIFHQAQSNKNVVDCLKNKLKNGFDYKIYTNARDKKGNTLLATALGKKNIVGAEELMKMRCKYELDQ